MMNSCILITKQPIFYGICKKKMHADKLAGAEKVNCSFHSNIFELW